MAGSSLAGNAIAWPEIATHFGVRLHAWAIPGGSPFEWEQFQPQVSRPQISFIVISAYDMNEALICDYRAQLVPLGHSIRTLVDSDVDLGYAKRALSQYPMTWLRTLYPTLGRSRGIMGDLRNRIAAMIKPESAEDAPEAGPTLDFGHGSEKKRISSEAISGWSQSEILRKVAVMRESAQGRQIFRGPKHDALARMAAHAAQQGRTVIVVLPVSATYGRAVAGTAARREFQDALDRIARQVPAANWLRLDQIAGLDTDDYYMDLVHMNFRGQEIATAHLQRWLNGPAETQ